MSFVVFPCSECSTEIEIEKTILPGDAGVILCPNCQVSWTVYCPSLIIKKTKDLPEKLQGVWKEVAKENG